MTQATETPSLIDRCRKVMGSDGVTSALAMAERAKRDLSKPFPMDDPVADATAALLSGEALPSGLGDRVVDAEERYRRRQAELHVLDQAIEQLRNHRLSAQTANVDAALDLLRDKLRDVLDDATSVVDRLRGIDDAVDAMEAGATADWLLLRALGGQLAEIRRAQVWAVAQALIPADVSRRGERPPTREMRELVLTHGSVNDFSARYPDGYVRPTPEIQGTGVEHLEKSAAPTYLPWDPNLDAVAAVRWCVAHRDAVWLPTLDQIEALRDGEPVAADAPDEPGRDAYDDSAIAEEIAARNERQRRMYAEQGIRA